MLKPETTKFRIETPFDTPPFRAETLAFEEPPHPGPAQTCRFPYIPPVERPPTLSIKKYEFAGSEHMFEPSRQSRGFDSRYQHLAIARSDEQDGPAAQQRKTFARPRQNRKDPGIWEVDPHTGEPL